MRAPGTGMKGSITGVAGIAMHLNLVERTLAHDLLLCHQGTLHTLDNLQEKGGEAVPARGTVILGAAFY